MHCTGWTWVPPLSNCADKTTIETSNLQKITVVIWKLRRYTANISLLQILELTSEGMCILIDLRCCIKCFSIKKNYFPTDWPEKNIIKSLEMTIFFVRPNSVDTVCLSVCLSVCRLPLSQPNGQTYGPEIRHWGQVLGQVWRSRSRCQNCFNGHLYCMSVGVHRWCQRIKYCYKEDTAT